MLVKLSEYYTSYAGNIVRVVHVMLVKLSRVVHVVLVKLSRIVYVMLVKLSE